LQTYQPEHYAILAAARHDYAAFYQRELAYRHALAYPPFVRLVRVLFRDPIDERARQSAQRAADFLIARINAAPEVFSDSHVLGATPCFFRRQDGLYRWQVLIRTVQAAALLEGLDLGTQGWIELDPLDTL
jgi:primosomal protein N' (replication factor Y)